MERGTSAQRQADQAGRRCARRPGPMSNSCSLHGSWMDVEQVVQLTPTLSTTTALPPLHHVDLLQIIRTPARDPTAGRDRTRTARRRSRGRMDIRSTWRRVVRRVSLTVHPAGHPTSTSRLTRVDMLCVVAIPNSRTTRSSRSS